MADACFASVCRRSATTDWPKRCFRSALYGCGDQLGKFDPRRASVGTYLFVIARSVSLDIRKRPSSRELLPIEEAYTPPQFDKVEQILDSLIMREALDTLSVPHRQVLRLSYDRDLTQSQIAERLGLPLGTVKTRVFHAMRALRTALDERGFHDA